MSAHILIVCLFPLIFVACASKKKHTLTSFSFSKEDGAEQCKGNFPDKPSCFSEVEAKRKEAILVDIPIPLFSNRIPVINDDSYGNQIVLGYQSTVTATELITLYREQMERYGWNLAQSFVGSESLLHFEKPTRVCLVSIRPHKKLFFGPESTDLIIYVEDSSLVW